MMTWKINGRRGELSFRGKKTKRKSVVDSFESNEKEVLNGKREGESVGKRNGSSVTTTFSRSKGRAI